MRLNITDKIGDFQAIKIQYIDGTYYMILYKQVRINIIVTLLNEIRTISQCRQYRDIMAIFYIVRAQNSSFELIS